MKTSVFGNSYKGERKDITYLRVIQIRFLVDAESERERERTGIILQERLRYKGTYIHTEDKSECLEGDTLPPVKQGEERARGRKRKKIHRT